MGFYAPHVFTDDAKRHGVGMLNPDINLSGARGLRPARRADTIRGEPAPLSPTRRYSSQAMFSSQNFRRIALRACRSSSVSTPNISSCNCRPGSRMLAARSFPSFVS